LFQSQGCGQSGKVSKTVNSCVASLRNASCLFAPKPVQKPCPALWVGGESGPAMRRAARLSDGWYPIGVNPRHRLDTMARYRAAVEHLRKLVKDAGRDPASVALTFRVHRHGPSAPAKADNGERLMFSGGNAAIIDDLGSRGKGDRFQFRRPHCRRHATVPRGGGR
jgi:alkanesulfonate monooxygenase SsuD/methylene tetrahydromethanopterin reductase-like flavin-dependent oxidoreductase (luciferase family)